MAVNPAGSFFCPTNVILRSVIQAKAYIHANNAVTAPVKGLMNFMNGRKTTKQGLNLYR